MVRVVLDIFLKGLDEYIGKQDHITAVSGNPGAYESEDELHMSEKSMRHSRLSTAQDFFDVIAFMHAVPQRVKKGVHLRSERPSMFRRKTLSRVPC